ncbi:LOW QUALITY PROTEIN: protein-methionine sulfoxide oxidase mical3b-like [Liolophura sinensis]|uniref:LOW QUALITY PROTEIN: protein-methionine sulfoxide oxidase mical3b-like n=1 Tax=Liolophura sinensis TaxID=3198878 RepID=UPI003159333B
MLPRKHVAGLEKKRDAHIEALFNQFINAGTCKSILLTFHQLCDALGLKNVDHRQFYPRLKSCVTSWKAQSIWVKLDKRASHKDYRRGEACKNTRVLVIGAGPCGLRVAIEAALLGAKVVLVEKRDRFSRNNVLHLWPYLITDLKNLGAKKFFGKFCAGAIDHISIRQLQCILMKVALLVGVEIHTNVSFEGLIEPPEVEENSKDALLRFRSRRQRLGTGWRARILPENNPVSEFEFDVLIGADGKRNTLHGFKRKEFRGKLAIAITANFINGNTQAEASVEEISGVAFIFNQKFFLDLKEQTGIDLENIVYYKDETHYFVMTAKKMSLLEKGVLLNDYNDTVQLLSKENVDQDALLNYAREAADFSTNHMLPNPEYAINHYGQPDVAMFDFTSMFASHNASRIIERNGHTLLMGLVGDSLLEPFWPTGTGCARGFLGAFDAAWMIRSFASGKATPLQVLAERESIFLLLSQTTPENLHKNFHDYSIDPNTRYPNLNSKFFKPEQMRHLYDSGDASSKDEVFELPTKRARNEDFIDSYTLLRWCQNLLNSGKYYSVHVTDFTASWKSGLALCALIHIFRPELIDFKSLAAENIAENNQLAFDVAQKELGVQPVMSGEDMAKCEVPDKLTMVSYLSQLYDVLKKENLPLPDIPKPAILDEGTGLGTKSPTRKVSLLNRLSNRFSKAKKRKDKDDVTDSNTPTFGSKRYREEKENDVMLTGYNKVPMEELRNKLVLGNKLDDAIKRPANKDVQGNVSVKQMGELLVSKFRGHDLNNVDSGKRVNGRSTPQPLMAAQPASEFCVFCKKRVYLMERMSAEGLFFHRGCLKCAYCAVSLRLGNYSFEKSPAGEPLFYCFRHFGMMMSRSRRKRNFEEADDIKENIEDKDTVDSSPAVKLSPVEKKTPPQLIGGLTVPEEPFPQALRTPERVEFENSLEGEEETEEEQTEHNLRSSISCDLLLGEEEGEEESDSDDELTQMELAHILNQWSSGEEDLEDEVMADEISGARELAATWQKRHSRENLLDIDDEELSSDEEDDTDEVSDYDSMDEDDEGSLTETESRNEERGRDSEENVDPGFREASPVNTPTSPAALKAARESFFVSAPEVVRLDPWSMFGMGKKDGKAAETEGEKEENGEMKDEGKPRGDSSKSPEKPKHRRHKKKNYAQLSEEDESDSLSEGKRVGRGKAEAREDSTEEASDENLDKSAVSRAMEQLLQDLDQEKESATSDLEEQEENVLQNVKVNGSHDTSSTDRDYMASGEDKNSSEEVFMRSSLAGGKGFQAQMLTVTERAVLNSVMQMSDDDTIALGSGEDTMKALMDSLEAMNKETDDVGAASVVANAGSLENLRTIDDKFVTTRGRRKKKRTRNRKTLTPQSSVAVSTTSDSGPSSPSSLSAEFAYNEQFLQNNEDDDEKPDEDMLRDYQLTLSQALGEDQPESGPENELKNEQADLSSTTSNIEKGEDQIDNVLALPGLADTQKHVPEEKESLTSEILKQEETPKAKEMENQEQREIRNDRRSPEKKKSKSNIVRKFQSKQKIKESEKVRIANTGKALNASIDEPEDSEAFFTPTAVKSDSAKNKGGGKRPLRKLPDLSQINSREKKTDIPVPTYSSLSPKKHQKKTSEKNSVPRAELPSKKTVGGKKKISVDRTKLESDSSFPKIREEGPFPAERGRTKIPLDSSLCSDQMAEEVRKSIGDNMEDIPFADDSCGDVSPSDEVFFTPQTSVRPQVHPGKAERIHAGQATNGARKRILPTPRKGDTPGVLPPEKIKEIQQAEIEKAKEKAREKARLKSDEELGLLNMNSYAGVPVPVKRRGLGKISGSDTDRSEFSRDSDDTRSPMSPLSPDSESADGSPSAKKTKNKRKFKPRGSDSKSSQDEQKSDSSSARKDKEKRNSLLAMLLPSKIPHKGKDIVSPTVNGEGKSKTKTPKTAEKHKKTPKSGAKKKDKKRRHGSKDNLDQDLSENLRDLKIGSTVWYDKDRESLAYLNSQANRAPKAEAEDMYDSDDSFMSTETLRSISRRNRHLTGDDEMSEKLTRKVQHAARRQQKQREQKRLRMAQEIQRRLEEVDVKQRELEERGVKVEQSIRSEGAEAAPSPEASDLLEEWLNLVHEKNALVRYESELMVQAKELELEDRQSRLEQELREKMAHSDKNKTNEDIAAEQAILNELLEVVEERDNLVAMLEEERLRQQEEDKDLESIMLQKGFMLSPLGHTEKLKTKDYSSESDTQFV